MHACRILLHAVRWPALSPGASGLQAAPTSASGPHSRNTTPVRCWDRCAMTASVNSSQPRLACEAGSRARTVSTALRLGEMWREVGGQREGGIPCGGRRKHACPLQQSAPLPHPALSRTHSLLAAPPHPHPAAARPGAPTAQGCRAQALRKRWIRVGGRTTQGSRREAAAGAFRHPLCHPPWQPRSS